MVLIYKKIGVDSIIQLKIDNSIKTRDPNLKTITKSYINLYEQIEKKNNNKR